jgi:hypothetical protein
MAAYPWIDLPHPTPANPIRKKSGNPYVIARLFSIFVQLNFKKDSYKTEKTE